MDKMKIQEIADQVADDMGYDFADLSPKMQIKVYNIAMDQFQDMMADKADMMRKNEASGGMMRANYREGSPDDIPEQEDMADKKTDTGMLEKIIDFMSNIGEDLADQSSLYRLQKKYKLEGDKKPEDSPYYKDEPLIDFRKFFSKGSDRMDQASGIKSLEESKMMASAPDPMAEKNDMSLDLFGKPLELLTEEEMFELEEKIEDQFGKRDAPSIKMAENDSAMDEYRKYVFEMREQGFEPVSFKQFLAQILSEARG